MDCEGAVFSVHAIQRMFQRGISREDELIILQDGQVTEDYPDDAPYPSRLLLGRAAGRWLHVVVARDT